MTEHPGVARERFVELAGPCNFRDLGGYPTIDGRSTRWGILFRSDSLHHVTAEDRVVLAEMGIATVIDLRTRAETTRAPVPTDTGWRYRHLSLLPDAVATKLAEEIAAGPPLSEDHAERYVWFLDAGRATLVTSLSLIADPDSHPLVFHCTAGKDRTGVLAALVLDLIGVERDEIVADYARSGERLDSILAHLRTDPEQAKRMETVPATWYTVRAETMERFLAGMDARYGNAAGWASVAGIPDDAIARLRTLLVE